MSNIPQNGRERVLISNIKPSIDGGKYALKRIEGEDIDLRCTIFADGHDVLRARVLYRHQDAKDWQFRDLEALENDVFTCRFRLSEIGAYQYKVVAWVDQALTWLNRVDIEFRGAKDLDLLIKDGAKYYEALGTKHPKAKQWLKMSGENPLEAASRFLLPDVRQAFYEFPEMKSAAESAYFQAYCDRKKAAFSASYELFPRSAGAEGQHGTFADVEKRIPRIAELGFDILLFPPIHPIGTLHRKGKNNSTVAQPDDVGSPWGIGSPDGGHTTIHPDLGSTKDFKKLLKTLDHHEMELALDLSFHASPDHPWTKTHPEWFKHRADGSLQYAENPPFKYEDIIPFDFECDSWELLWKAIKDVVLHWINEGVKIFRADNAHNKPFGFWKWLIAEIQTEHPDVLFLTNTQSNHGFILELVKLGFAQMGSEYLWKNFRHELINYTETIFAEPYIDFIRPGFWPNTHDSLPLVLQSGNPSSFMSRLFMAGTLSSNYGIYGPVFENMEQEALPGTEEYKDSEKYELKTHPWDTENKLTWLIKTMNTARRELSPLQQNRNFRALDMENKALFAYIKWDDKDRVVCVVNLDPYNAQEGWLQLPIDLMPIKEKGYRMHDFISGADYPWREEWNYVRLDPARPVHLFKVID